MKTTFAPEAVKASSQIADAARSAVSTICRWSAQSATFAKNSRENLAVSDFFRNFALPKSSARNRQTESYSRLGHIPGFFYARSILHRQPYGRRIHTNVSSALSEVSSVVLANRIRRLFFLFPADNAKTIDMMKTNTIAREAHTPGIAEALRPAVSNTIKAASRWSAQSATFAKNSRENLHMSKLYCSFAVLNHKSVSSDRVSDETRTYTPGFFNARSHTSSPTAAVSTLDILDSVGVSSCVLANRIRRLFFLFPPITLKHKRMKTNTIAREVHTPGIAEALRPAVSNTIKAARRWSVDIICLTVGVLAIAVMMLGFIHANLPLIILSSGIALLAVATGLESAPARKGGAR